jgi:hypothetical protein
MENETKPPNYTDRDGTFGEDLTSLNISGHSVPGMSGVAETSRLQSLSGARWFYWVAALSVINSVVALADGQWSFLAGLGITQVISGFALGLSAELGGAVTVIALALDLIVALIFVGLGVLAQKQNTWAFIVGMLIYALDGMIFLFVRDWLSLAFHAFVLFCIYRGLAANRQFKRLQAEGVTPA